MALTLDRELRHRL